MHRLAVHPGSNDPDQRAQLIEQLPAPVLVLTSADTDLRALAALTASRPALLGCELRGLNLAALSSPAQIDHYLSSTVAAARLVVVRLLGGRGHWSYGLEQLQRWAGDGSGRQLLVLAGTAEEELALSQLSSVDPLLSQALARCWRSGGEANLAMVLKTLSLLLKGTGVPLPEPVPQPDPMPHDWREEPGPRVGVVLYRALLQANDCALMEALVAALRRRGLAPRALWVSGLRDAVVTQGVARLLARERVEAVVCGTAFASVQYDEAGLGAPLWDGLGVPVLQVLASGQARDCWERSSIGLGPLDLSLQVALPELDGRLTTRIGAFKESVGTATNAGDAAGIGSALHQYQPDSGRLDWIAQLCSNWVTLGRTTAQQRRIALVLANYPTRNGRLANGVGLDTPASCALMLQWLQQAGYELSEPPGSGAALIEALLGGRSNDPESDHLAPMDRLPLVDYLIWYGDLPAAARDRLELHWGAPQTDPSLLAGGGDGLCFPIRGLRLGNVTVLIQPARGYERDPAATFHSPDLPPTHAYLAQYLWLRNQFGAHAVVHVGKHGNLEWLPGKALGLSDQCFPELALGPLPHLYPFIVNDPGEGSQAKRRCQAVILDHLTPPLGRAGLHGPLLQLEALLDEYWQARALGAERTARLRQQLGERLGQLNLLAANNTLLARQPQEGGQGPSQPDAALDAAPDAALDAALEAADGYLCELKEAQIRLGLHTYGTLPDDHRACELLLCLARAPQAGLLGLTQALALDHGLELDPWADPEEQPLSAQDRQRLLQLIGPEGTEAASLRKLGDGIAWLEDRALGLISQAWHADENLPQSQSPAPGSASDACLRHLCQELIPRLRACADAERQALLNGLSGGRIQAGPAGAPTRGRPDLLPTGRNFYSVDLRGLPTETAWDLGRRSAELLLELHLQEQGEPLRTLALSVWGTATMRNGGEDIAQALALLGVRPVWDGPTRRLVDLETIPLSLLQRPRVDVTLRISGLFRDAFPQLVVLFNRATALVAALDEQHADNPLAATARIEGHSARVYGSAPGAYGAGLQALIDSGQWDSRQQLGEAFMRWSSWRYETVGAGSGWGPGPAGSIEACADRSGLEQRLAAVQVVLHNQDNREHDLLDSDDYYQFQGGLSAAAEQLQGQPPALWFADHSRQQRPRLHRLERELDKVLRSRLLNPRWIEAMGEHGYKGGFEMAASLDYLFAYDASTGRTPDWGYGAIQQAWLEDPAVRTRLEQCNPWALRDMAERLLEAHNRGLWQGADPAQLERLRCLVRDSEALTETATTGSVAAISRADPWPSP